MLSSRGVGLFYGVEGKLGTHLRRSWPTLRGSPGIISYETARNI